MMTRGTRCGLRHKTIPWVGREFRIPFSQIRFAPGSDKTFGLLIVRDIARPGERISWPLLKRSVQGYVSQAGDLSGIGELPSPRRLEILPYTVVKSTARDFGVRPGSIAMHSTTSRLAPT